MANRWGTSATDALKCEDGFIRGSAYYYGEDGTRVVIELNGANEDTTVIINGNAEYCASTDAINAVFNRDENKHIDHCTGWSKRP